MKTAAHIGFLFFISAMLCACPFSSVYKLDDEPTVYVDDALVGKWATFVTTSLNPRPEAVKMILNKRSDFEYDIAFIGFQNELRPFRIMTGDSIKGTAFLSDVGGRRFFNINIKSQFYIAELQLKDEKLSLLPLAEHFTAKMIRNNSALRSSVDVHYKTRVHPMIDEDFRLMDMIRVN